MTTEKNKKLSDSQLFLIVSSLNKVRNQIINALSDTGKFEVKPPPEQYEDAEKVFSIIQVMQDELKLRLEQERPKSCYVQSNCNQECYLIINAFSSFLSNCKRMLYH